MPGVRAFAGLCLLLAGTCLASSSQLAISPEMFSYVYSGNDLGAVYRPEATVIKVWAPTAKLISVLLFDSPEGSAPVRFQMDRDRDGVWSVTIPGNHNGKYYLYEIGHVLHGSNVVYQVNDPYARGCSINTGRTLIYDSAQTNPDGWENDHFIALKRNVDAIIYEVHVRDFSIARSSGAAQFDRGKYLGMVRSGLKSPGGETTGIDHLKEIGITHVQILPVHEYMRGDEREGADNYSWYDWGYGPVLYNTPEGSYASDPNGVSRQREFKQMVQAFHNAGIGVILDVVYNHTFRTGTHPGSIFDKVFPLYYYRTDATGAYANGTGCGNEFASERPMARKFILDSIRYWISEYHVDGFRFDLMGIEDRDTMTGVYREAKRLNPNAILYGEGWSDEHILPASRMMTQTNVCGTGIGAFNDGIRDNVKGSASDGASPGFVQGAGAPFGGMTRFWLNVKGESTGKSRAGIPVCTPNETINYDSCHDDHCLWDKLTLSARSAAEPARMQMDKLAAGIILTAQGVPFIHAGDEFLRSKNFVKNSYNDNRPEVNPIDWSLKSRHKEVFEFYRGLVQLRKAHPAFRMYDRAAIESSIELLPPAAPNLMAYRIKDHANGDTWETILVAYNGAPTAAEVKAHGQWQIVANQQKAGVETLQTAADAVPIAPFSLVVAHSP